MNYKKLIGTWVLVKVSFFDESDKAIPSNDSCHGHLIFTPDQFVSASINRVSGSERKDSFYFAQVILKDEQTLIHKLIECSKPDRIGSSHERHVSWDGEDLILSGEGPSGKFQVTWSRKLRGTVQ